MTRLLILGLLYLSARADLKTGCRVENSDTVTDIFCSNIKIDDNAILLNPKIPASTSQLSLQFKNCSGKLTEYSIPNLRELNFLSLVHSNLDEFVLPTIIKLSSVEIAESTVPSIEGAFKNLNKLSSLSLFRSKLKLDENSFKSLSSLTSLRIEDQNIILSGTIFRDLKNLKYLEIINANIEKIPSTIFQTNTELERLNLGNNPIKTIEVGTFESLKKLKQLYLKTTALENFNADAAKGLKELFNLGIPARAVKNLDITKLFKNCPNLRNFYFSPKDTECAEIKEFQVKIKKTDIDDISVTFSGNDPTEKTC